MEERPDQIPDYRDLIVWQEAMDIAEMQSNCQRLGKRLVQYMRSLEGGSK